MKKNILILEDDNDTQKKIQTAILSVKKLDATILRTSFIKEAEDYFSKYSIDIFIIDIKLPDGNGIEFANKVRMKYPMKPIIFETSVEDDETELKVYRKIKHMYYIRKPLKMEQIVSVIDSANKLSNILNKEGKMIKIHKSNVTIQYKLENILYCESVNGDLCVVSYDCHEKKVRKEYVIRYYIKDILKNLEDPTDLIQCHRSYIINPKYIVAICYNKDCVELEHIDKVIPIGGKFKKNLY